MSLGATDKVRPEAVLRGHKDSVNCICFLENEILSSGSADGVLKLWSISSRRTVTSIEAHEGSTLSINVVPSLQSVITCGRDGYAKLWRPDWESRDAANVPALRIYTGARHFCNASCDREPLSDCNILLTPSSEESEISVWDLRESSKKVATIKQDRKMQTGGGLVAEKGMVFSLLLQSRCKPKDRDSEMGHSTEIDPMTDLSSSVPQLLAGYEDGSVCCFDIRTFKAVCSIRPHTEPVMAMDLSPDGQHVLSAGGGNVLARSSLTSSPHTSNTSALDTGLRSALKERPSGPTTWTSPTESIPEISACMEDTASSQSLVYYDASELPVSGTSCVKYRRDGRIAATGHWDNTVRIFDTKKMKPLAVLSHHRDKVYAVDFAPSGSGSVSRPGLLATGSKDGTIALWNLFEKTPPRAKESLR